MENGRRIAQLFLYYKFLKPDKYSSFYLILTPKPELYEA